MTSTAAFDCTGAPAAAVPTTDADADAVDVADSGVLSSSLASSKSRFGRGLA